MDINVMLPTPVWYGITILCRLPYKNKLQAEYSNGLTKGVTEQKQF